MTAPTAVIAEDEPLLRAELRQGLAALWPDLRICAEEADGIGALKAIDAHAPDIVFLDVEMPGMSGIDVARLANGRCHIVFVTAYDKYAVAAFEQQAADYLLKPLSTARLAAAVTRVKERIQRTPAKLENLLDSLSRRDDGADKYLRWITASQGTRTRFVTVDRVCYFQADNKYTMVMLPDADLLIRRTIKELAESLDPKSFWQIHRSTVINVNEVTDVTRNLHGHTLVHLRQRKEPLPVSETYAHLFRQM